MANIILTPTVIAKEAMKHLKNALVMGNNSHRAYKHEFLNKKTGGSITIPKPVRFRSKSGATLDPVDLYETSHTLTVATREHVAWDWTSQELTMTIDQYADRYLKGAAIALANKVDVVGCELYKKVFNMVGTPGSTPNEFADLALAAIRLDDEAVEDDQRKSVLNPLAAWTTAGGLTTLNNQQMVDKAVRRGFLGDIAGFATHKDQNIQRHTTGTFTTGSTPVMNGATAEGAVQLVTDGWANSTAVMMEGDVFTIPAVYAVNPVSGQSTGVLRQFVATADITSDGSGNATITISPQIYSAAGGETYLPYQTVDALPADGAAITPVGTEGTIYPQNLCFHKNAFALVTVPLALPDSANWKARHQDAGLSIRIIKFYDGVEDRERVRMDIFFGWDAIYPDMACRLVG
jgi:P22 coat protein - gene protein 5